MSQRHKLGIHSFTAAGEIIAQGAIAPGYTLQVGDEAAMVEGPPGGPLQGSTYAPETAFEVPAGPPGGPLQGSSLAGPIPDDYAPPEPPDPIPGPEPGPDPEPGQEPTLNSINPSGAAINDPDLTMNVNGQRFTNTSLIYFNGSPEPTTFVSDSKLSTVVKPSTATTEGQFPVWVQQGSYQTSEKTFTFIAENETWTEPGGGGEGRTFPMGPYNIVQIRYDDELGQLVFQLDPAASGAIENGDTIVVEATGTTAVNGTYTAENVAGPEFSVTMASTPLTAVIDNKGRATVTGGE